MAKESSENQLTDKENNDINLFRFRSCILFYKIKINFFILFDKLQFHPIKIYYIQLDMIGLDLVGDVQMKHPNLNDYPLLYLHYYL